MKHMATKKTSMFTLTERLTITASGTETFATIDLGSYVDVGDRQAIQVSSVDYNFQGTTAATPIAGAINSDSTVLVQVTDLNRGGLVFSNDRALVSSAALYKGGAAASLTMDADIYPDNYGSGSNDGRYVVNDQLYITGLATALAVGDSVNVTVRVNANIVTLTAKDFMAIAIQSTAADN
jgi:hypothetical protein